MLFSSESSFSSLPLNKREEKIIPYKCIYYTNLFSIEFAACSNSSKLIQVLSMLNKRKPTEKSASAADAFLNYKTGESRNLTKPLGQTLRSALLPASAEGFLPLLAGCSIASSLQSSPRAQITPLSPPPRLSRLCLSFLSIYFSFSFSFPLFIIIILFFCQQEKKYLLRVISFCCPF